MNIVAFNDPNDVLGFRLPNPPDSSNLKLKNISLNIADGYQVNKYYTETPPAAPGILQLINDIEHGIFDNIPIGGATWVPETASKYNGEVIYNNPGVNETLTQLQAFAEYIREGKAPEELTREGYNASIWAILGEMAIDSGQKLTMPTDILIS